MGIEEAKSGGKCGCCGRHYHAGDDIDVWTFGTGRDSTGKRFKQRVVVMRCPHCPKDEKARLPGLPGDWAPVRNFA